MKTAWSKLPWLVVWLAATGVSAVEVDERPLPIGVVDAFPQIRIPRPVIVTHAGDGSRRLFVGSQFGEIHVVPQERGADETHVVLDIR